MRLQLDTTTQTEPSKHYTDGAEETDCEREYAAG